MTTVTRGAILAQNVWDHLAARRGGTGKNNKGVESGVYRKEVSEWKGKGWDFRLYGTFQKSTYVIIINIITIL